jgi:MFS superfamily sulfate permease-like transporter
MGYTKIAGMPVITGLYTILVPIAVFALLGSSRHLVVGADSATAAILFAGLAGLAQPYSPEWVALAGWLAILAAGFLILARILRLGFLADFLSSTVLIGFLTGVGVQVACGQIAGMLGVTKTGRGPILQAFNATKDIPQANWPTVAVSAGVLLVIVGARLINKKIPGALIAVIGAIAASEIWNLSALGVATLGAVPSGLPHFGVPALPPVSAWGVLVATAGSLFLVILAQSAATSRAYAVKYDEMDFKEDVDLVGLGLSNVAAGLSGTFVVNGSPTKTQMVDGAGGRSQLAQLTTAVITLCVLLFLTKPLSYMPNAVLAAVVFLIGVELVDVKGMARVLSLRPVEFWVALITAATVVVVGVEQGILLAIALSLIVHIRHSYHPTDLLVTYTDGEGRTHALQSGEQAAPGLLIYHFGADLFYANSEAFQSEVLKLAEAADPRLEWLVIDASAIGDIDYTGHTTLSKLIGMLADRGITLGAMNLSPELLAELDKSNIEKLRTGENVYLGIKDVVAAFGKRNG